MSQFDQRIDARGDQCPLPVVKTKKMITHMGNAGVLEVLVDNETAVQNVSKLGKKNGASVTSEKRGDKEFAITLVLSGEALDDAVMKEAKTCGTDVRSGQVVVISSDVMGGGDDLLGSKLIKAFIFALTQQDTLPAAIIFYNGGVRLTVEGSEALEDLKSLEAQGTEIVSCGTCLDFYGLKEQLAVGSITNMYDIVERMETADSVIKPS